MAGEPEPQEQAGDLDAAVDAAIAACDGDARAAVRALLIANTFLEAELEAVKAKLSRGFTRGKFKITTTANIGIGEDHDGPSPVTPPLQSERSAEGD